MMESRNPRLTQAPRRMLVRKPAISLGVLEYLPLRPNEDCVLNALLLSQSSRPFFSGVSKTCSMNLLKGVNIHSSLGVLYRSWLNNPA